MSIRTRPNDFAATSPRIRFQLRLTGFDKREASSSVAFFSLWLIVDRSIKPKSSSIVIADVDGEWMVKRLYKRSGIIKLLSENPLHAAIVLEEGQELVIFGLVTYVINEAK